MLAKAVASRARPALSAGAAVSVHVASEPGPVSPAGTWHGPAEMGLPLPLAAPWKQPLLGVMAVASGGSQAGAALPELFAASSENTVAGKSWCCILKTECPTLSDLWRAGLPGGLLV